MVRQAILAAVDAEAFMSSMGPRELWSLCASAYYCNTPLESEGGAHLYNQNNVEKARQLIKDAGAEGATIKVMNLNDYGTITPLCLVLKPMLESIGLKVEIPGLDWATLISKIRGDDYNMFTTWWAQRAVADPITDVVVARYSRRLQQSALPATAIGVRRGPKPGGTFEDRRRNPRDPLR